MTSFFPLRANLPCKLPNLCNPPETTSFERSLVGISPQKKWFYNIPQLAHLQLLFYYQDSSLLSQPLSNLILASRRISYLCPTASCPSLTCLFISTQNRYTRPGLWPQPQSVRATFSWCPPLFVHCLLIPSLSVPVLTASLWREPHTTATTLARLPGAGANAERSLAPTAGIRGAAALALKSRPGSAASDRQARFREPQPPGPQGGRRGSPPWLWPRTSRGQGVPPASPAAPIAASRSPERPFGSWLAPPRLWLSSQSAWNLPRDRTAGAGSRVPVAQGVPD